MSEGNVVTAYLQFVLNVAGVYITCYPFLSVTIAFLSGAIVSWKVSSK
jgi:hypothetical protein